METITVEPLQREDENQPTARIRGQACDINEQVRTTVLMLRLSATLSVQGGHLWNTFGFRFAISSHTFVRMPKDDSHDTSYHFQGLVMSVEDEPPKGSQQHLVEGIWDGFV